MASKSRHTFEAAIHHGFSAMVMRFPKVTFNAMAVALPTLSIALSVSILTGCGQPPPAAALPVNRVRASDEVASAATELPSEFVAERIFVRGVTVDGQALRFYTDSGGGLQMLYTDAVKRLGLGIEVAGEGNEKFTLTRIPRWRVGASLPAPLALNQRPSFRSNYVVADREIDFGDHEEGFLGQGWFGGRVWTFDYPAKRLLLRPPGNMPKHTHGEEIPFHLPRSEDGAMQLGRITVQIEGEPIDFLFDTGATTGLSSSALEAVADGLPAVRATSFIVKTTFDRWRAAHPTWRVLENAEQRTGSPMIEVPRVTIGDSTVGPVWFTLRPDRNFHQYMSRMMDARVEGALGGSGLRYFRVSVDYTRGLAVFQRGGRDGI